MVTSATLENYLIKFGEANLAESVIWYVYRVFYSDDKLNKLAAGHLNVS